jgi:hypothetical protein
MRTALLALTLALGLLALPGLVAPASAGHPCTGPHEDPCRAPGWLVLFCTTVPDKWDTKLCDDVG